MAGVARGGTSLSGDDVERRWRTLQLVAPVYQLLERAAPRAQLDHERYDLGQLALRAVDFVVGHQASIEGSVGPARVVDHLTDLARRMSPDDPARPWAKVAKLTFSTLLNDGRPHQAHWVDLAMDGESWAGRRPFSFRLLRLTDAEDGAAVSATDEAVLLYLQALDTNLADRAMALKLIVERQMVAGEFDRARATAVDARRTAEGLAASLRDKLDDTRRDVRSVDWAGEMPDWLSGTLAQLGEQLDMDRQLLSLAATAGENPAAASDCRAIVDEVRRAQDVWLRLERRLQAAIPTFLAAQQAQRFNPGARVAAVDLVEDILGPMLSAETGVAEEATAALFGGLGGVTLPALWSVDSLAAQLLRSPATWERPAPAFDDVGDLVDVDDANLPAELVDALRRVLLVAADAPVRLSTLLDLAATVGGPARLPQTVWTAALWVWVVDNTIDEDAQPADTGLARLLAGLAAVDDGEQLIAGDFAGPDLLVGPASQLTSGVPIVVAAEVGV
jgi:hypothetical protein